MCYVRAWTTGGRVNVVGPVDTHYHYHVVMCVCVLLMIDHGHIKSSKCKDLPNHFTNLKKNYLWDFTTVPLIYCEKEQFFH